MNPPRQSGKRDPVREGEELGNAVRNERQKTLLLCEIGKIQRKQVGDVIQNSKEIVEESKKLVGKRASRKRQP